MTKKLDPLEQSALYMNIHTGSVDTGDNWECDVFTEEDRNALVEVRLVNGEYVEV